MNLEAGAEFADGRYVVMDYVGAGGMQHVYLVQDTTLSRVKVLKYPKSFELARRFQRSAALSARVNHPNVAKTLDYFDEGDQFFLIEEWIDGSDLGKIRRKFPRMDPYLIARMFHHLSRGLAASHRQSVVHRDLKPSNIMIAGGPTFREVKITDFGIAKMAEEEMNEAIAGGDRTITSSHTLMGAIPYLSPEMAREPKSAGAPTDVWSLAAIMFHLMTGEKPFGENLAAIANILDARIPHIPGWITSHSQFRSLGGEVYSLIRSCLAKDPDDRPTADEVAKECEKFCYPAGPRELGTVDGYPKTNSWGYIKPEIGFARNVFFHVDSVFTSGGRPSAGTEVLFTSYKGSPRHRAHPVILAKPEQD